MKDETAGTGGDRPQQRLRTYVSHSKGTATEAPAVTAQRRALDRAGVAKVMEFESQQGRTPEEMPHTNPGYDLESYSPDGELVRFIEVKSVGGEWGDTGAALTDTQFAKAQAEGDRYWLYIVERAQQDDYRIYCVQDPARRVGQFFYDGGWKVLAEAEKTDRQEEIE